MVQRSAQNDPFLLQQLQFKATAVKLRQTEKQRLILSVSVCAPNQMCHGIFFPPSPPMAETHYLLEQEKKIQIAA